MLGPSIEYHQTLCHLIRLSFLLDNAIKGLEESQLAREGTGYETAVEREIAYGDKLDLASDADKDGGSSSGAPPLLLLASEGEASRYVSFFLSL